MAARKTDFEKGLRYLQKLQKSGMVCSDVKNIRPRRVNISIEPRRFRDFMAIDAHMRYEPFVCKSGDKDDYVVSIELFYDVKGNVMQGVVIRDHFLGGNAYVYGYRSSHRSDVSKTVGSVDELLGIFGSYFLDEMDVLVY